MSTTTTIDIVSRMQEREQVRHSKAAAQYRQALLGDGKANLDRLAEAAEVLGRTAADVEADLRILREYSRSKALLDGMLPHAEMVALKRAALEASRVAKKAAEDAAAAARKAAGEVEWLSNRIIGRQNLEHHVAKFRAQHACLFGADAAAGEEHGDDIR